MSTKPKISQITTYTLEFDYDLLRSLDISISAFYSVYRTVEDRNAAVGGAENMGNLGLLHHQILKIREGAE